MIHLGDITKIHGDAVPAVNVIIGGSPCQDLSIAGKRAGLDGERSGLFMDQLRVIKEMRRADAERGREVREIRPRFMVWENVPGAFSSNGGADFGAVLQETVRVVVPEAPAVSVPTHGWPTSGCLSGMGSGGGFSVAWRVFDAQFWGVPQRRRRIALVADFGGFTAPEILFERKSVSGDSQPLRTPWEILTAHAQRCAGGDDKARDMTYCIQGNCIDRADTAGCNGKGWTENVSYTLNTIDRPAVVGFMAGQGAKARSLAIVEDGAPTLKASPSGLNQAPCIVYDARGNGDGQIGPSVVGDHNRRVSDYTAVVVTPRDESRQTFCMQGFGDYKPSPVASACKMRDYKDSTDIVVQADRAYTVRRLTPTECERLQGFPDGWTDIGAWTDERGKLHKDSSDAARYKALGNSIALPPWMYVLQKLSLCCGADHTMASLFDGIGGFPLIWEWYHGKGSCVWASEIERFPIAVTKTHFKEA